MGLEMLYIPQLGVGEVWVQILRVLGARALVILVLREYIWKVTLVSLVLSTFDNTDPLGSLPRQVVYSPGSMVSPWLTATTFSSPLLFIFI